MPPRTLPPCLSVRTRRAASGGPYLPTPPRETSWRLTAVLYLLRGVLGSLSAPARALSARSFLGASRGCSCITTAVSGSSGTGRLQPRRKGEAMWRRESKGGCRSASTCCTSASRGSASIGCDLRPPFGRRLRCSCLLTCDDCGRRVLWRTPNAFCAGVRRRCARAVCDARTVCDAELPCWWSLCFSTGRFQQWREGEAMWRRRSRGRCQAASTFCTSASRGCTSVGRDFGLPLV